MVRLLLVLVFYTSSWCAAQIVRFETTVAPLSNEDITSDCHYTLTIAAPSHPISAVWIFFDRGRDVHDLYTDERVVAFARRFHIASLLHGHCPGKAPDDHRDMNMDPSYGLGRALFTALSQFAKSTGHSELSSARLVFLGFSGAGSLCARLVDFAQGRAIAAILSSPGHYEPLGIDTVVLGPQVWAVPELILTGSADDVSGTARPYLYFRKYYDQGAPWAFVVQNNSPHCCTANAKRLILGWLEAVITRKQSPMSETPLRDIDQNAGWRAFIRTQQTNTKDSFGLTTFRIVSAKIQESTQDTSKEWKPAGWLPNRTVAKAWLSFVEMKRHPILPLH